MGIGSNDRDDVKVKGDDGSDDGVKITSTTDGTKKRLDVSSSISSAVGGVAAWRGTKLNYVDMNASSGGVARDTLVTDATWVKVYEYSGSGLLSNFLLTLEDEKKWDIRLVADAIECFGATGIKTFDMENSQVYNLVFSSLGPQSSGINFGFGSGDNLFWGGPLGYPVYFASSVKIFVKRASGGGSKKWRAGLVIISKD